MTARLNWHWETDTLGSGSRAVETRGTAALNDKSPDQGADKSALSVPGFVDSEPTWRTG
jgi:hypothetical protein